MFFCSVAAAAAIAFFVSYATRSEAESTPATTIPDTVLADIEFRLAQLEEQIRTASPSTIVPSQPTAEPMRVPLDPAVAGPHTLSEIIARLEKLEAAEAVRVEAMQKRKREQQRIAKATMEQASQTILDSGSSDRDKLLAWRRLKPYADKAWTDAIVQEMVRIGLTSMDETLRTDVWRQAKANTTHPLLVQPLLRALRSDLRARVRVEAAETLEIYVGEPGVADALRNASQNDKDARVREQSKRSLDRGSR